jgi:hypothetical protein
MPAHSRFWGSPRGNASAVLSIEQVFGNAWGFVLAHYLRGALCFGCFGLIGYPFGLLRGSYGVIRGIWLGLLDWAWGAFFWVFAFACYP